MKILNTYNQQQYYTSFGNQILKNSYLRDAVQQISESGTPEEQALCVKFMDLIGRDTSMRTFAMRPEINLSTGAAKYYFDIDGAINQLSSGAPFINPKLRKGLPDPHFLEQLTWFIRDHYGERAYNQAVRTAAKYKPKYVQDSMIAMVRKFCV